jgi:hypothetical protein
VSPKWRAQEMARLWQDVVSTLTITQ